MRGGKIAICPDRRPIDRSASRILNDDITRHVLIEAPEAVLNPGPDRRASRKLAPGVDVVGGGAVVLIVRLDPVNEGQIIDVVGQMGEKLGEVATGLSVALKLKLAADTHVGKTQTALEFPMDIRGFREGFAVEFPQSRSVLEGIHLAHAALHEEENALFCFSGKMRSMRGKGQ